MNGHEYRDSVALRLEAFGLSARTEYTLGNTHKGKSRRCDIVATMPGSRLLLVVECKRQNSSGSVEEKVDFVVNNMNWLRRLSRYIVPAIVYGGAGFSNVARLDFRRCPIAFEYDELTNVDELPLLVACTFGRWDIV